VKVIGRLPGETTCLSLVWAVLDRASHGWRGLTITPRACGCYKTCAANSSTRPPQRR
jgi:putative transposase